MSDDAKVFIAVIWATAFVTAIFVISVAYITSHITNQQQPPAVESKK